MTEGPLTQTCTLNIIALGEAINNQTVHYCVNYGQIEKEVDLQFIIVSESKSLFGPKCILPLQNSDQKETDTLLSLEELTIIRNLITVMKNCPNEMSTEIEDLITNEFTLDQKTRLEKDIGGQTLLFNLNISQLIAKSLGKNEIDLECWRKAKELENKRMSRIKGCGGCVSEDVCR
jgi:hypothetical protein